MKLTDSEIILRTLRFHARHGVEPQERLVGARFTVDLALRTDIRRALDEDDLGGTVDYAAVYRAVNEEMQQPSRLLEHAGGRIARRLLSDFPAITQVRLRLMKQNPPMGADCEGAGIEITCTRD